jgi:hypothetical protein
MNPPKLETMLAFPTPAFCPMYHPSPAKSAPKMVPHLMNQILVLTIQLVVLYRLTSARYAARKLMRGGMMVCASHCHGLDAIRDDINEISAVNNASECERNESRNEYRGGGSCSARKPRRGSRKAGSGMSAGSMVAMIWIA